MNNSNPTDFCKQIKKLGPSQKQPKINVIELFSISINSMPNYFSKNSKVFFQQRAYNYLSDSTTNHFFFISFMASRKYSYIFSAVISSGNISSLHKPVSDWLETLPHRIS